MPNKESEHERQDSRANPLEERGNDVNRQGQGILDEHKRLQVPCRPITEAKAKGIKETIQGLAKRPERARPIESIEFVKNERPIGDANARVL